MTRRVSKRTWRLGVCALVGVVASATATFVHYRLLTTPVNQSFCDIGAVWSCTNAYLSEYGQYLGVPVAIVGVLYFVTISLLLVADRRGSGSAMFVVAMLSIIGSAFVLYLGYTTVFTLKAICIICLMVYGATIGLLVGSYGSRPPVRALPQLLRRDLYGLARNPLAIGLTLLLFAGASTAIAYFPRKSSSIAAPNGSATGSPAAQRAAAQHGLSADERTDVERAFDAMPRTIVPIDTQGAKAVIVTFNDFQCPACANAHSLYKPVFERWERDAPGQIKVIVKDFPLELECNSTVTRDVHQAACEAAAAVRLARQHQRSVALEEWFYANQTAMTPDAVRNAAREVGGVQDFEQHYQAALAGVKADVAMASALGVTVTPTVFINGVKLQKLPPPDILDAILAHELRKGGVSR